MFIRFNATVPLKAMRDLMDNVWKFLLRALRELLEKAKCYFIVQVILST